MPQVWHYTTTSTALSDGKTAQNTAQKNWLYFFCKKNLQKPNQKVFFLHIVIANILIEKEVVYNRRERACPSGKSKTAPAWYTRDNRGIAKRKNEEKPKNRSKRKQA